MIYTFLAALKVGDRRVSLHAQNFYYFLLEYGGFYLYVLYGSNYKYKSNFAT